ncbi:GNAT family N-acetyltransferase [Chitinophaga pendula]|uniref:GNAT family N-acetyltransferase n=1 Tax=Chitinophaga TaxID=79328 RepID=UPI000BAFA3B9|nr:MULTISPECIES: GNAT family N-acetyltransferase [Chitinophaga]ASZ12138.1 GNAT family N-acetyltransferase [Chitinophaga sp. MD30]UCJ04822.1 GNAT family N-acetyltransferase [Chitinophaga pendula]
MEDIHITSVGVTEIEELQRISIQTFVDTFASHNAERDMAQYLEESFSQEKLMAELGDAGSAFYFARSGEQVIGYVKINTGAAQTEVLGDRALEIERIYVRKEYHGKNIGQLLYEQAFRIAREKDMDFVWLGVWEKNARALRFYEKNGFSPFGQHIFRLGGDDQIDILVKKTLK